MLGLILRCALDPVVASHIGAALAGEPELGDRLVAIARRESRLQLVGVHEGDAWMARRLGAGWSTRGVHGHVAAYAWPYVPAWLRWAGPAVLDVPLVSAVVSARRARSWRCRQVAGCRSWLGLARVRTGA